MLWSVPAFENAFVADADVNETAGDEEARVDNKSEWGLNSKLSVSE